MYPAFFINIVMQLTMKVSKIWLVLSRVFSKFLMGGGLKIFGPRRSPMWTKSDGGGTCEKNPTEGKTAHLIQN